MTGAPGGAMVCRGAAALAGDFAPFSAVLLVGVAAVRRAADGPTGLLLVDEGMEGCGRYATPPRALHDVVVDIVVVPHFLCLVVDRTPIAARITPIATPTFRLS